MHGRASHGRQCTWRPESEFLPQQPTGKVAVRQRTSRYPDGVKGGRRQRCLSSHFVREGSLGFWHLCFSDAHGRRAANGRRPIWIESFHGSPATMTVADNNVAAGRSNPNRWWKHHWRCHDHRRWCTNRPRRQHHSGRHVGRWGSDYHRRRRYHHRCRRAINWRAKAQRDAETPASIGWRGGARCYDGRQYPFLHTVPFSGKPHHEASA